MRKPDVCAKKAQHTHRPAPPAPTPQQADAQPQRLRQEGRAHAQTWASRIHPAASKCATPKSAPTRQSTRADLTDVRLPHPPDGS
ncbi:hypothetical protein PSCLAVI8L_60001 [Pseudoclavibacter sp. 8L]|nr:hypothetical protein PSCLAVI8L_60001 [Pseudoclavibacter sp. 8L]